MADERSSADTVLRDIRRFSSRIGRSVTIMEVCGTHTVSLRQNGIHSLLPAAVRLISGPGCPVCVTPPGFVDNAIHLMKREHVRIATFGDMLKVPGTMGDCLYAHDRGTRVSIVYSPLEAVKLAQSTREPVVFLGIGFETTAPTIAHTVSKAEELGLENFFLYSVLKRVPPALHALLADPKRQFDALLLPGHVSTIIGVHAYRFLEEPNGMPGAITGFRGLEMLLGIRALLAQLAAGKREVENLYPGVVRNNGNKKACEFIAEVFKPQDSLFRGLGMVKNGGLALKERYAHLDAEKVFHLPPLKQSEPEGCRCSEVIQGKAVPPDCSLFAGKCTPEHPVGPCMISSEGSCAAYLKYGGF